MVLMRDIYKDDGQHVSDPDWITYVSTMGLVALTKDAAIVRAHNDALRESTARVFALPNSNLTGPQMADRFAENIYRVEQWSRKRGPFVCVVHSKTIEQRWP